MKMLSQVQTGRLYQLADFLETVPPEDFDLRWWRTREPIPAVRLGRVFFRKGCGFAGCAMGWGLYAGLFPEARFDAHGEIVFRGATNYDAVGLLLGITGDFAGYLFDEDCYADGATPWRVAQRIRRAADRIEARCLQIRPQHEPEVIHARQCAP